MYRAHAWVARKLEKANGKISRQQKPARARLSSIRDVRPIGPLDNERRDEATRVIGRLARVGGARVCGEEIHETFCSQCVGRTPRRPDALPRESCVFSRATHPCSFTVTTRPRVNYPCTKIGETFARHVANVTFAWKLIAVKVGRDGQPFIYETREG